MKSIKITLLFLTLLTALFAICSCSWFNKNEGNETEKKENLIYDANTPLSIIFADNNIGDLVISDFYNDLFRYAKTDLKLYINELPEKIPHEIVIGYSDREVSKKAYELLGREEYDEVGDVGYVIYSDGASVAIAYTENITYDFIEEVIAKFAEDYCREELILPPGTVKQEKLNLMESIAANDKALQDKQWDRVAAAAGEDVANAMKNLYKLYTPDIVTWLANLYEERVCVCTDLDENGNKICRHPLDENGDPLCQYGGFYYSNSARNTVGYAPDIESTNQALSFLESSGMLSSFGGQYANAIPDWMKNEIVSFVKGLQDPNGYFYHPQWSREMHHSNAERMGRDLSWAKSMLTRLGARPYYTTPDGAMIGERAAAASGLTSPLGQSAVVGVSRVVAASSLNAHLESPEAFRAYLDKLNITTQSYSAGSIVGAQTATIKALDRQYAGVPNGASFDYRNKGRLSKVLLDWLDENQNPENGLWDKESDYQACDGLFKIVNIYNDYQLPMNYALKAAEATIAAITSDEQVYTVCNMYNAWANIGLIKKNISQNTPDKQLAEQMVTEITNAIILLAPDALEITRTKTANFAITDGSFSYLIGHSSETSTGMPTAVVNSYEGDVNATLICVGGLIGHINNALDLPKVNPYGLADWYVFIDIVESNNSSLKDETAAGNPLDFEYDEVGESPSGAKASVSSGGSITVEIDPEDKDNKVLNINHPYAPGKGDSVKFTNHFYNLRRTCSVFESDFYVSSEGTDSTYVMQFTLGAAYYFTFRIADGKLGIWEDTTTELSKSKARHLTDVDLDEWFNIKVEYYVGDHDSVRIKFYVNKKLIAVSANYGDYTGKNVVNESGTPRKGIDSVLINPLSYVNVNMYMDNVLVTSVLQDYVSEAGTSGLVINADMPETDRITHDFANNTLPDGFNIVTDGGNIQVSDGALNLTKNQKTTTLTIARNLRVPNPNAFAFGFDIDFSDADNGEVLNFAFTEPYHYEGKTYNITKHAIKCITEDGKKYLVITSKNGAMTFTTSKIPLGEGPTSIEFVYYTKEAQTLVYVGGKFVGLSDYVTQSNPHIYELGYVTLNYTGKMVASLDNVFLECRSGNFTEDTTPDVDRVVYDFEEGVHGDLTTDGSIKDGALYISGGQSLTIPLNKRVDPVVSTQLFFNTILDIANEKVTRIALLDGDGKGVFAIDVIYDGANLILYEVTENGRLSTAIVNYTVDSVSSITLNYYPTSKIVTFKVDGVCVLATGIFYSEGFGDVASAVISSDGASIDDLYFEGLLFNYVAPTIVGSNRDDFEEVIGYEYSSSGKLPSRVSATLSSSKANSAIVLMMRNGERSKVLSFTASEGGNDYIDFTLPNGVNASKLVFETDVYFDFATKPGYFEIHLLNGSSSSNSAYRAILRNDGTSLYFYDTSGNSNQTPGPEKVIGKINEWFKLRIEIDLGDGTPGTTFINTYVNGVKVYESQNFFGSYKGELPAVSTVNRVRFYTWGATEGSFYFDNTVIKSVDCLHTILVEGDIISQPTCQTEGKKVLNCQNPDCTHTVIVAIPKSDHEMGEWVKDEENLTERRDCIHCDHYEEQALPPPEVNPDEGYGENDYIDDSGWTEIGG